MEPVNQGFQATFCEQLATDMTKQFVEPGRTVSHQATLGEQLVADMIERSLISRPVMSTFLSYLDTIYVHS